MLATQITTNVLDLESFSLAFRPLSHGTEIIQYKRELFTKQTTLAISSQIRSHLEEESSKGRSLIASLAFLYSIFSENLELREYKDRSKTKSWFVADSVSSKLIDVTLINPFLDSLQDPSHSSQKEDIPELGSPVFKAVFDLLMNIQSSAKRYNIDEIVSLENKDQSEFLQAKKNLDYLYNLGVFGTFPTRV